MKRLGFVTGLCLMGTLAVVLPQAQGAGGAQAPAAGAASAQAITGTRRGGGNQNRAINYEYGVVKPLQPDARGWGWQTKSYVNANAQRPFWNYAKEMLFQDKQVTSITIGAYQPELYCEAAKHFDYIWFEMQHSTMSFDEVRRMLLACPSPHAAPMIRLPDALESSIQKATDIGVLGIIVPTVDDALEARDAARFSRYPPFARRSLGGGSYGQVWPNPPGGYRNTINDNFLVVVMIETLEGVANADEIAATQGVDVVILGNNDLSSFSGWLQTDARYQDAITIVHNAALKAGKYYGNAGQQYLTGNRLSPSTRFVQDGPARDGWTVPASLRAGGAPRAAQPSAAPPPHEEPVIGLPGGEQPASRGRN
jgi:2-keto-3-deoxy-L-rhamnonate aldolase RhmA